MSAAAKFECAPYKPFEPDYHPQRPIIIGEEGLDSPETVTLKYEEAVARANGDLRGASPPEGLLPMSQYGKPQPAPIHGYDTAREYQDAGYSQYAPPQEYPEPQHDNGAQLSAAQINQEAFAANSAVPPYLASGPLPAPVVCHPTSGMAGTKVAVKMNTPLDPLTMTSPLPYFFLAFGTQKMMGEAVKSMRDTTGYILTFTAEAPDPMITGCSPQNVPLSLMIEAQNGQLISRSSAGEFAYHDASVGGPGANPEDITRKSPKSPEHHPSPRSVTTQLAYDGTTNTYDFARAPTQGAASPYGNAFPQDQHHNNNMLSTYRSASFTEHHYPRAAPPPLRPPMAGWQPNYARTPGPPITHTQISRPSLTPMPITTPTTPTLVRTTSLQTSPGNSQGSGYPTWGSGSYTNKANLNIIGKLETMTEGWTSEEWTNRRRIVMFNKKQSGSTLTATFRGVSVNERPPNSVCISCIWWAEKSDYFVTSVDTIYLLEQLVVAPNRFSVEEKNRIRRNLEGFRPQTVSKAKENSEEFFKIIMAFPNPKPRNIEKDVKVFPWKILESALKKIIGKYSASPSSTVTSSHMLTPAPGSAYPTLPTLPTPAVPASVASDPVNAYAVPSQLHHHDLSPRSSLGSSHHQHQHHHQPHHWSSSGYPTAPSTRALSPALTATSPRQQSLRLAAPLPGVSTYDTRAVPAVHSYSGSSTGMHHSTSLAQQTTPTSAQAQAPPRWDAPPGGMPTMHTPTSYGESYPPLTSGHHHAAGATGHQAVYGSSGYGDGAQRA